MAKKTDDVKKPSKILLRNPTFKIEDHKLVSLTGTCIMRGCKQTRTIKPQDAFQVRYCAEHQAEALRENRRVRAQNRRTKATK